MTTFVLIHGAWHGGWCWGRVRKLLIAAGHDVYAPTLAGLGYRYHENRDGIDLSTHIAETVGLLEWEDLTDVALVGHSYAGMVITGVAERIPGRIGHLVYLDAVVPRHGETVGAFRHPDHDDILTASMKSGPKIHTLEDLVPDPRTFGITDPTDLAWVSQRLVPHPPGTTTEALNAPNERAYSLPRTYVLCTALPLKPLQPLAALAEQDTGWRYRELVTGHDCMITDPVATAALLIDAAASAR